jgi:arylsulfatase
LLELTPSNRQRIIRFLAMIRNLDGHVGQLRAFLREQAIERNTILIFMTDNGSTFGPLYYNAGMRGAKMSLWEGGHRVPCFVHWPEGELGAPRDIGGLTQVQDMLPTLVDLCELAPLAGPALDGISLAAALRGDQPVPEGRMLAVNYSRMPNLDYPTPDSPSIIRREGAAVLWKRWRLVEATELYDLESDPAQECNVIDRHPDIARKMQDALDDWWREVEPVANQVQRIIIGSEKENPMMLSACEWKDVFVDQQKQVRIGVRKNSYWHLQVERAGTYQFELRRWPRESGLALGEACPAAELTDGFLEEGLALPIAQARLMIERRQHTQAVEPGDTGATFTLQLDAGPTLLHTWFYDASGQPLCGAYYVYVSRLD